MKLQTTFVLILTGLIGIATPRNAAACSVFYYYDEKSQTAFVANNEDYYLDQKVDIVIAPARKDKSARIWYGWDDFAQGGVNEHGVFLDGAVTPEEEIPEGYRSPRGNIGDRILASCKTIEEALDLFERERIALKNAHVMIGDRSGRAVVVEWIDGERRLTWSQENHLVMTNFLLAAEVNAPRCGRHESIRERIVAFRTQDEEATLLRVGNFIGGAVLLPRPDGEGRTIGTLYSTFLDLTNGQLVFVPRLDSSKAQKFDLTEEFGRKKGRKIVIR